MNLSGSMGSAKALIDEYQVAGCKTAFQSPLQGTAKLPNCSAVLTPMPSIKSLNVQDVS